MIWVQYGRSRPCSEKLAENEPLLFLFVPVMRLETITSAELGIWATGVGNKAKLGEVSHRRFDYQLLTTRRAEDAVVFVNDAPLYLLSVSLSGETGNP